MSQIRSTQRVPHRCTECARRRIRCSKNIPCDSCIKRGKAHECAREIVKVDGRVTMALDIDRSQDRSEFSLIKENSALHQRIAQLELALAQAHHRTHPPELEPESSPLETQSERTSRYREKLENFEHEEELLQNWDRGLLHNETVLAGPAEPNSLQLLHCLPDRAESTRVVNFSLEKLGWIHCALRVSVFQQDHASFWDAMEAQNLAILENHQWLMLYYSVLSVGSFFIGGLGPGNSISDNTQYRQSMVASARTWYDAAFREFELSQSFRKPSLATVQLAVILTLCNSNFGESQREALLLGNAISTARVLKMHRLGSESTCPKGLTRRPEWSTRAGRDLGRRLWWSLTISDWLGSLTKVPLIAHDSFDCVLVRSPHDWDIVQLPPTMETVSDTTSPIDHHIALATLASISYSHVKAMKTSTNSFYQTMQKLDQLEKKYLEEVFVLPDPTVKATVGVEWNPDLVSWQRHNFIFAIHLTNLNMCRAALGPSLESERVREDIHTRAVERALAIVDMRRGNACEMFNMTWNVCSATIAAGVFLALDVLSTDKTKDTASADRQRDAIIFCIAALRQYEDTTEICRHGVQALERLVDLEKKFSGLNFERSVILRMITDLDRVGGNGGGVGATATTAAAGDVTMMMQNNPTQDASTSLRLDGLGQSTAGHELPVESMVPYSLDSGGILDEYFLMNGDWTTFIEETGSMDIYNPNLQYFNVLNM